MTNNELAEFLRNMKVETGSLLCLGCGHEHNCGIHGCAILSMSADALGNSERHVAALHKEIKGWRRQYQQLREAAALVTKESAELLERRWIPVEERLPELQSWGASEVVLGLIKSENAPSLNKLHNLTLCVYCDNGIWSMPGRYVAITHWMPLPELPKEET